MLKPPESMSYFFERIDEDNFLITWENGKQQKITSAELIEFLSADENLLGNLTLKPGLGDLMSFYLNRGMSDYEEGKSLLGERCIVVILEALHLDTPKGSSLYAEFEITGESGKEYKHIKLNAQGLNSTSFNLEFFAALLQLYYSGNKISKDDESKFKKLCSEYMSAKNK